MSNKPNYIETRSQGKAWFWDPGLPTYHVGEAAEETIASINLADIGHALSNICRFGGHVSRFYSVAEHAALVADKVYEVTGNPAAALAALHHDDHEAYVGDVPRPLKLAIGPNYQKIAAFYDDAIGVAFSQQGEEAASEALRQHGGSAIIKAADDWALLYEAYRLLPSQGSVFSGVEAAWPVDECPEWVQNEGVLGLSPYGANIRFITHHETYSHAFVG